MMLALLWALVACSNIDPLDAAYTRPGCDAWQGDWVGEGRVVTCDAQRMVVRYDGAQPGPVMARWRELLRGQGWEVAVDNSDAQAPSVRWKKQGLTLVTGVAVADGATWATVAQGGALVTPDPNVPAPRLPVPSSPYPPSGP